MSNLLKDASILLTPTGYDNGSMNAIKPENGGGDFTFSRNSAATRVNAQGLVENVQIISPELVSNGDFSQIGTEEVLNGNFSQEGSELVTNGDFATDSDWILTSGTSISNNKLNVSESSYVFFARQTNVVTIGKQYKVTFDVDIQGGNGVIVYLSDASAFAIVQTSGTHTFYLTADGTQIRFRSYDQGFIGSIDNVSVKEVGQNWDFGGDWTVGENKIIHPAGSSPQYATQDNVLTIGKNYTYSVELLTGNGSNFAQLYVEGVGAIAAFTNGAGVYTGSFTASGTNIQIRAVNADIDVEVTNISIKEVGQDWIFQNSGGSFGWQIYDGKAICDGNASTPNRNLVSSTSLTSGKKYKLNLDILQSADNITIYVGGGAVSELLPTGTNLNYTLYFTAPSSGALTFFASTDDLQELDNISVKEITDDTDLPRINYEGFSYQDSLGSELVTNGDFATDSDWSKDANWTIANGIAASTGTGRMFQSIPFLETNVGTKVKVSFDITDNSNGGVVVNCYGGISQLFTGVGTHTFTTTTTNSSNLYFNNAGAGANFVGSIDNVSVKEYLGQEVIPDSGCGSWLLEPQSTNLVTYSEDFSQWNANNATIESGYLAPDGTNNAYKVSGDSTSSLTFSLGLNSTDTRTIWARTISGSGQVNLTSHNNNTNNLFTITEQWQRFEVNGTTSSSGQAFFYAVDFRGSSTLTEVVLWGAQAENLSYATSYIPTNGATNTRLQDIANNSGNASLINSTEGVLYAEIAALADDGTNRCIGLSDGTTDNRVNILFGSSSNRIRAIIKSNGSTSFDEEYNVTSTLDYHKVEIKYKANDFALWIDGVEVATDTSGATPIGLDRVTFDAGNGTLNFYGKCKALAVYKEALTDAQLQSLTTI